MLDAVKRLTYNRYMNSVILNVKTDPATKKATQEFAQTLGISVSALMNAQLRQMLRDRTVVLTDALEPTPYLEKIMRRVEKDLKSGRNISPPMTVDQALEHLRAL